MSVKVDDLSILAQKLPRIKIVPSRTVEFIIDKLSALKINTICVSGRCPNRFKCFSNSRVSILILGDVCTRGCRFCGVKHDSKGAPFEHEIEGVAKLVRELSIGFLVITSVSRDDLPDFGAAHFCNVVTNLRKNFPQLKIELLIPDFQGDHVLINKVMDLPVEIIGHNVETVPRLYKLIRPKADYQCSMDVLKMLAKRPGLVKSSIMLGLGETLEEVKKTLIDIKNTGCNAICIGQYLPPKSVSFPVEKIYHESTFEQLYLFCKQIGFEYVWSHPLVRSSFVGEKNV